MNRKPMGASMLFINQARQVLLLLRDDKPGLPFPNCWDVPGGGVEAGETAAACIIREMAEEIERHIDDPRIFHSYDLADRYETTFWQRAELAIEQTPLHEGQCLRWFSQEEIAALPDQHIAFGFKPIIMAFFQEAPFAQE